MADTHLGYKAGKRTTRLGRNQRQEDIESAFINAIDLILERDVDAFIHAGDIFHMPKPGWRSIAVFIAQMQRLVEADIRCHVIAGNHDTSTLRTPDTVFTVIQQAVPELLMASGDRPEMYFDLGKNVLWNLVPSMALRSEFPPTMTACDGWKPDLKILVLHGIASDIANASYTPEPGEEQVPDTLLTSAKDYDYIAMGDWHSWQQVRPNAWYSGATERMGWGEYDSDPGFLIVDLDPFGTPVVEHVSCNARPMFDMPVMDASNTTTDQALGRLCASLDICQVPSHAVVRQLVDNVPDRAWHADFQRKTNRLQSRVFSLSLPYHMAESTYTVSDDLANAFSREIPKLDIRAAFADYVESRKFADNAFSVRLMERGLAALQEAEERVQEAEVVE